MNIYIDLPQALINDVKHNGLSKFIENFNNNMRKYYGEDINISINFINNVKAVVYIMGEPSFSGCEENINNDIRSILSGQFNTLNKSNIDIKLGYARLNPNFRLDKKQQTNNSLKQFQENVTMKPKVTSDEFDYDKLSHNYNAEHPRYSFEQVILPEKTQTKIEEAIGIIEVEEKVFDEWGLRSIIPYATSALSFYGPPGTGKSMAAEAVAHKLGKKILSATYADIESKFHGEGPKMVKAIFKAAERENAVLFLDESDSLLSKRLTNVSDASAQAINSMRSQLLISLEHFKGIVIFATNLVVNYDKAFLSRLINIEFTMPDNVARTEIWNKHLKGTNIHIPLSDDVNITELARKYEFCGREIKNAVKNACIAVALQKHNLVTQNDFIKACEITKEESEKAVNAKDYTKFQTPVLDAKQKDDLKMILQKKIDSSNNSITV